jgi:Protein of unknown function (DUF3313)
MCKIVVRVIGIVIYATLITSSAWAGGAFLYELGTPDLGMAAAGRAALAQAALRYVNPSANWTQYNKIVIDPVTFWGSDTEKISATDQQALTDYFYQVLREELGKKFQIVDQAGPGVWKWGDAENAMKAWATQTADRLSSWTSGTTKPS